MSTQETLLGRCIGVPGLPPCGRKVFTDDVDAMELEDKRFMCGSCVDNQFAMVPKKPQTASQFVASKRKGGKASAKLVFSRPHVKPENTKDHKRLGINLAGSKNFTEEDRVPRKKRRQSWGWEQS